MKVLNLYAGIGGNRKLWEGVQVTAVELDAEIAGIYKEFYPEDVVVIGDAHQFLLDHYKEYDFIWSSPPCQTHSKLNRINEAQGVNVKYPDMSLYQEIILLTHWYNGKWCIENVIGYYTPLIPAFESNSHYWWSNFKFRRYVNEKRGITNDADNRKKRYEKIGIDLSPYKLTKKLKEKVINNCVEPEIALHILDCAREIIRKNNTAQMTLSI